MAGMDLDLKGQSLSSDEEIKQRLAKDSDHHFVLVVQKYWNQLVHYSAKLVGSQDAEDVVQVAMSNAMTALRGYSQERILKLKLRSWIYTITIHECLAQLKRRPIQTTPIDSLEKTFEELTSCEAEQPETAFEQAQVQDAILTSIEKLPPTYREAIFLRYIRDMKEVDIVQELGVGLGTIKSQISRGTALLRMLIVAELEARGEIQLCERLKRNLVLKEENR